MYPDVSYMRPIQFMSDHLRDHHLRDHVTWFTPVCRVIITALLSDARYILAMSIMRSWLITLASALDFVFAWHSRLSAVSAIIAINNYVFVLVKKQGFESICIRAIVLVSVEAGRVRAICIVRGLVPVPCACSCALEPVRPCARV